MALSRLSFFGLVSIFLLLGGAHPAWAQSPTDHPVVTVEPPCPVLPSRIEAGEQFRPVEVRIRYDPQAPRARLRGTEQLTLVLGLNFSSYADKERTVPLRRQEDDTWETTVEFQPDWEFALFYFRDERHRTDDNHGNYWEVVTCEEDGIPSWQAIQYQARSYTGEMLAPGIQRAPDYNRAIAVLQEDLERNPDHAYFHLYWLWHYKLKRGGETEGAYQQVAAEIDQFLQDHQHDLRVLEGAARFVFRYRSRLPARLFDKLLGFITALDPHSGMVGEAAYVQALREKTPDHKVAALRSFAEEFPDHWRTDMALEKWLSVEVARKNVAGAEEAFQRWRRSDPESPQPYLALGRFYVEEHIKFDQAVKLLTRALELSSPELRQKVRGGRILIVGGESKDYLAYIRYWRGLAHLELGNFQPALEDLEDAAEVLPAILTEDEQLFLALGRAHEGLGNLEEAAAAYLEAATAPYQVTLDAQQALERLFVKGGVGTKEELEERIATRLAERRRDAAADYEPAPVERPVPFFKFTTLDGEDFNSDILGGRPVVLNFWSVWCAPCIPELAGFQELQQRHPGVVVAAIATNSKPEEVRALLEERNLTSLRVALSEETAEAFGGIGVPRTFVLDAQGRIRFVHTGALPDVVVVLEEDLAWLESEEDRSASDK